MKPRSRLENSDEVEEIRELLRARKIRATPARILVLQELRKAESPVTHGELAEKLVPLGFDKATLFRNLTDLTEVNLISRNELGDHVWRFEAVDPDNADDTHPHFVCVECGDIQCLGDMNFTAGSTRRAKDVGRITEILLKGFCAGCENASA